MRGFIFPKVAALFCLCVASVMGTAQIPMPMPSQVAPKAQVFESAQSAIEALVEGVDSNNFDLARRALDLHELNFAIRDTEGVRRAQMAVAILNRAKGFITAVQGSKDEGLVIPIMPSGGASTVARMELSHTEKAGWRVSAETVAALPDIWARMRDAVPVNGYTTEFEGDLDNAQKIRSRVSPALWREIVGIEIWQWLSFVGLWISGWVFSRILRGAVSLPLRKKLGESGIKALDRLKVGISWLVAGSFWFAAMPYLDLPNALSIPLTITLKAQLSIAVVKIGIAIVDVSTHVVAARATLHIKRADSIYLPILRNFARFVVIGLVLWGFLVSLDINVTGLVAGLGIGGLVLALAAKDSVENVFGSLTILFDMPFGIGDWIRIGDEVDGIVEEINLRSTRVRTFDDSVITVPNSNLTKAAVENLGARRQRRINFLLSLSRTDATAAIAFAHSLREAMRAHPKIRDDNAYAYVTAISEVGVSVVVKGYILTSNYEEELTVRQELVEIISEIAEKAGVEFAPIQWASLAASQGP